MDYTKCTTGCFSSNLGLEYLDCGDDEHHKFIRLLHSETMSLVHQHIANSQLFAVMAAWSNPCVFWRCAARSHWNLHQYVLLSPVCKVIERSVLLKYFWNVHVYYCNYLYLVLLYHFSLLSTIENIFVVYHPVGILTTDQLQGQEFPNIFHYLHYPGKVWVSAALVTVATRWQYSVRCSTWMEL